MLHLIPPRLHRALLRVAHELRKVWWRLRKPEIAGVGILVMNASKQVLLVRHSYERHRWTLPGGGIGRGELPASAAARELAEELRLERNDFDPIGVDVRMLYGARCVTHVFSCNIAGRPQPDGREITEARFFDPELLPPYRSRMVDKAIAMLEPGLEQG